MVECSFNINLSASVSDSQYEYRSHLKPYMTDVFINLTTWFLCLNQSNADHSYEYKGARGTSHRHLCAFDNLSRCNEKVLNLWMGLSVLITVYKGGGKMHSAYYNKMIGD